MTPAHGAVGQDERRRSPSVVAAELVLRSARGNAVHYRDIATEALASGVWRPTGRTPHHTLNRDIREEVLRAQADGRMSSFLRLGGGYIAILPAPDDLRGQAVRHRHLTRRHLIARLLNMHPRTFELLIAELLRRMAFENVSTTRYAGDDGVDVTATWVGGGVLRQRVVAQVKRTERNLGRRVVRDLRGALDHDDCGLLVTTGGFQRAARTLAEGNRSGGRRSGLKVSVGLQGILQCAA